MAGAEGVSTVLGMPETEFGSVYGSHVMLRVRQVAWPDQLDDPQTVGHFLRELVTRIGMRILDGPLTASEQGDQAHYGYSSVVILQESHAAIHTYPRLGQFFLDVFSCRPFDTRVVIGTCEDFFGAFEIAEQAKLDRGLHWPGPATERLTEWTATR